MTVVLFSVTVAWLLTRSTIKLLSMKRSNRRFDDIEKFSGNHSRLGLVITISQPITIARFEYLCKHLLKLAMENTRIIIVADMNDSQPQCGYTTDELAELFMRIFENFRPKAVRTALVIGDYPQRAVRRQILQSIGAELNGCSDASPVFWLQPKSGLRQCIISGVEFMLANRLRPALDEVAIIDGTNSCCLSAQTQPWCLSCELAPLPDQPLCGHVYEASAIDAGIIDHFMLLRSFDLRNPFEAAGDWDALQLSHAALASSSCCHCGTGDFTIADRLMMQSYSAFRRLQRLRFISGLRPPHLDWLLQCCWPIACWSLALSWTIMIFLQQGPMNDWWPVRWVIVIALCSVFALNALLATFINRIRLLNLVFQPIRDALSLLFRPALHLTAMFCVLTGSETNCAGLRFAAVTFACLWWSLIAVASTKSFGVL